MPNYCENDLYIHGPDDALDEFVDFNSDGDEVMLIIDRYIPYPDEYRKKDADAKMKRDDYYKKTGKYIHVEDGFNNGGYDWRIKHWGTKWEIADHNPYVFNRYADGLFFSFLTAWSPPIPYIVAMSKKHPELTFHLEYFEGGMGFQGKFEVKGGGEVTLNDEGDYDGMRGG